MMNSFFKTLIAYNPFDFFSSANMTFPKLPLPSTAKKLKSSKPTFRFGRAICCEGRCGRVWDAADNGRSSCGRVADTGEVGCETF